MGKRKTSDSPDDILNTVLENACDIKNRTLYVTGDIDEDCSYRFIVGMHTLEHDEGPITVILNTAGGYCTEGFAIYDAIKHAGNPVYVVGTGQVSSMGTVIIQAADKRLLSPNCEFFVHNVRDEAVFDVDVNVAATILKDLKRLHDRGIAILASRSSLTREQVEKYCRENTTFTAQEAVGYGLADSIVESRKK